MKRVLFATIAAGGGHVAMSHAVAQNLSARYGNRVQCDISDAMLEHGAKELDAKHKQAWKRMLQLGPWVRAGQRVMDTFPTVTQYVHRAVLGTFARGLPARLDPLGYDLIITTHGWLITALNTAIAHGLRTQVLHFAIEPFDSNALWADTRSARVVTTSRAAKADLVRMGVPKAHIAAIGYPVPPAVLEPRDQVAARQEFGLENRFTVLYSIGAEGVGGPVQHVVSKLATHGVQQVVLTGRNAQLKQQLDAQCIPGVHTVPFTNRVLDYVAAANVVLAKAGPSSLFEALAQHKPVVITKLAARNELRNMEFVVGNGFGTYATSAPAIVAAVRDFQREYEQTGTCAIDTSALQLACTNERFTKYIGWVLGLEAEPPLLIPPVGVGAHDMAARRRYERVARQ